MNRRNLLCLTGSVLVLSTGSTVAHHGWGSYDAGRKFTVTGTLTRVDWQNPHVTVALPHEGRSWEAVLAPPFRMSARGLAPEMMPAGAEVTVEGYPSTRADTEMRAERITVAGKTYELR